MPLQLKRVNVFNKTTGILQRVSKIYAAELVRSGEFTYTTKNKMKCFLNREAQLTRNFTLFRKRGIDIQKEKQVGKMPSGKTHAIINSQQLNVKQIWNQHFNVAYN